MLSAWATGLYGGDEIVVPIDGGSLLIGADFHPSAQLAYKVLYPDSQVYDLAFTIKNETPSRWTTVRLRFDIGGLCEGKPRQWSIPIAVDNLPPHSEEWPHVERGTKSVSPPGKRLELSGKTVLQLREDPAGCSVEIINAVLLSAERNGATFDRAPGVEDMSTKLRAIQAARDLEAEEQAKKDAAEAARQKQLAAQRRAKQAGEDAQAAKTKREQLAKEVDERRKITEACRALYQATANKRVGDLTVREEQQVRACQGLGLYRPQ